MTTKLKDHSPLEEGRIFGRLKVQGYHTSIVYGHSKGKRCVKHKYWCSCQCGEGVSVSKDSLLKGATKSCGCLKHGPRENTRKRDKRYAMWSNAKARARVNKLDFDIDLVDIVVPELCPVFGIPLVYGVGKAGPNSPSLDRLDNSKGYTKDNVWVISYKANEMKNRYSLEQFKQLVEAIETHGRELKR